MKQLQIDVLKKKKTRKKNKWNDQNPKSYWTIPKSQYMKNQTISYKLVANPVTTTCKLCWDLGIKPAVQTFCYLFMHGQMKTQEAEASTTDKPKSHI